MTRLVLRAAPAVLLASACSSMNTGTDPDSRAELACIDTVEALARAAERCGAEYQRTHDMVLRDVANGDCKNVKAIRDEALLRSVCLATLRTDPCTQVLAGQHDPACSAQLQRTASFTPQITP